jgi:phenylacetate-CoA ligase
MLNKNFHIKTNAFSNQPFSFVSGEAHADLATLLEIDLLENGSLPALHTWQNTQVLNLLKFAYTRSHFWKNRLPPSLSSASPLEGIAPLTRYQLNDQVSSEGCLFQQGNHRVKTYASSGSTGIPVKVHAAPQNGRYNELRSLAQYFIEQRSLHENRTFIKPAEGIQLQEEDSNITVEHYDGWLGNLAQIFQSGSYKIIRFRNNVDQLVQELLKHPVGYLACLSSHLELLIQHGGEDLIRRLGITMWLHHSDSYDHHQWQLLNKLNIPVRSNYSCTEVGPIGFECLAHPGYYHVAHSNVIVEAGPDMLEDALGNQLSSLLITHLHSYATPLIRYEVGDYGLIHPSCPCGHFGTTLSHIKGRKKYFITLAGNHVIPFPVFSKPLLDITHFRELFIYQTEIGKITIELGGREDLSPPEKDKITHYLKKISHPSLLIEIIGKDKIDWSKNPKRLTFVSTIHPSE